MRAPFRRRRRDVAVPAAVAVLVCTVLFHGWGIPRAIGVHHSAALRVESCPISTLAAVRMRDLKLHIGRSVSRHSVTIEKFGSVLLCSRVMGTPVVRSAGVPPSSGVAQRAPPLGSS